jgi:hypothetical protein
MLPSDVDGTLITSSGTGSNRLHKEAFSAGFKAVFGVDTHIDVIKHHGGTDPLIAIKVLEHAGIPREQVSSLHGASSEPMQPAVTNNVREVTCNVRLLCHHALHTCRQVIPRLKEVETAMTDYFQKQK